MKILVIEFEYAYLHFDKIYGFCMVALATSYFSGLRTFYLPTGIFLSLILRSFRKYLSKSPNMQHPLAKIFSIWPLDYIVNWKCYGHVLLVSLQTGYCAILSVMAPIVDCVILIVMVLH